MNIDSLKSTAIFAVKVTICMVVVLFILNKWLPSIGNALGTLAQGKLPQTGG